MITWLLFRGRVIRLLRLRQWFKEAARTKKPTLLLTLLKRHLYTLIWLFFASVLEVTITTICTYKMISTWSANCFLLVFWDEVYNSAVKSERSPLWSTVDYSPIAGFHEMPHPIIHRQNIFLLRSFHHFYTWNSSLVVRWVLVWNIHFRRKNILGEKIF